MVPEEGIRFFIRCIYCSIIGSVARDKRSQPNLLIFAAPVLILPFTSVVLGTALNDAYDNANYRRGRPTIDRSLHSQKST